MQLRTLPVPQVKCLTDLPAADILPRVEPCGDLLYLGIRIPGAPSKFHNEIQFILTAATTAVTPVCFNCLLDKRIQKRIEPVFEGSCDTYLATPLRKLTDMFFLSESLFHVMISFNCYAISIPPC